jgi:glycosyltransferase involved in cell wall biosynthesis
MIRNDKYRPSAGRGACHNDGSVRLCFLTSTPLNVFLGSGTFAGITTLAAALRGLRIEVETLDSGAPATAAARIEFNERLAQRDFSTFDATIGFDLDGYLRPTGSPPHIVCLKGVIADELRFEEGEIRAGLAEQAELERRNLERADHVVATSRYSAQCIVKYYGYTRDISVVPELIDLGRWNELFGGVPPRGEHPEFRLLTVGRFYARKRIGLLLEAVALLTGEPHARLRIVGDGLEGGRWQDLAKKLDLGGRCRFLGDVSYEQLAAEYLHADAFVFPSAQEGFGIVLLEAMAAGLPIIATRSAAIPEVAPHALFAESTPAGIAEVIRRLTGSEDLRRSLAAQGRERVLLFEAGRVAEQFAGLMRKLIQ